MARLKLNKIALLLSFLFVSLTVSAQSIRDVKINEVLVKNDSLITDTYGKYSGWIELYNTGYSSVNVGGCYISLKKINVDEDAYRTEDGVTYRIPTNASSVTTINPQSYLLIYAGGISDQGPNYANFVLDGANDIVFSDASGKIIIDEVLFDQSIVKSNVSFGREVVHYKEVIAMDNRGEVAKMVNYTTPTPGAVNHESQEKTSSESMLEKDPKGVGLTLISMGVVFSALLILFIIFLNIGKANLKYEKHKEIKNKPAAVPSSDVVIKDVKAVKGKHLEATGEVIAAISFAINQYRVDVDNMEYNILTINKTARSYSPWSSKIHTLTHLPERK